MSWLKQQPTQTPASIEDHAVDRFMEKFVLYPCNETSTPGFLEHLPSLFQRVNIEGRYALRWAVRAAAYADLSKDASGEPLAHKALHCYGMALSALGQSLAEPAKTPDDYDLMTVVILDIFETLFLSNTANKGAHAQGMAQILRLRGSDQVYNPRGWSLFRLAHHRIQKQQLALGMSPMVESNDWLEQLSDDLSYVRIEKDAFKIKQTCVRAQSLLNLMVSQQLAPSQLLSFARDMLVIDEDAAKWRQSSKWAFKTLRTIDLTLRNATICYTPTIQLHSDIWNAYEWNYHRTARIIFHQQLLKCLQAALDSDDLEVTFSSDIWAIIQHSIATVHQLADEVLSTVPQAFGDIDPLGRERDVAKGPPKFRAIGSYLLLWPIKIIKAEAAWTTEEQKRNAQTVFERIRDYTGMKSLLGDMSCI
ncbi:hypothetical protein TruAng_004553 [Truncatella angustata]|nr:hypothetical protein TruAng_004553 [Truncatella angustata]